MIITTEQGQSFDTDRDLSEAERHVLQKLLIWQEMAASVAEFRRKKRQALRAGWNDSGPIPESQAMKSITQDLEDKLARRLRAAPAPS